jgi:hypothetical protein
VNWEAIGAVGEIVGASGVVISLLYLAVQIRGDARAKRAATVHEQSEAFRAFLQMIATDKELGAIYLRGLRDFHSLDEQDRVRFSSHLGFLFRVFEENFFQWEEGHLDADVWRGFESPIADTLAYPGVQAWWLTRTHWYSLPFGEFVQTKINTSGVPSLYGENDSQHDNEDDRGLAT